MSAMLVTALADLNLKPGQCEHVQVNGYKVEIRRIEEEETRFADQVMLEPWVTFPDPEPTVTLTVRIGPAPLPDPPFIPSDEEGFEP